MCKPALVQALLRLLLILHQSGLQRARRCGVDAPQEALQLQGALLQVDVAACRRICHRLVRCRWQRHAALLASQKACEHRFHVRKQLKQSWASRG